jgi:hypothetical protein
VRIWGFKDPSKFISLGSEIKWRNISQEIVGVLGGGAVAVFCGFNFRTLKPDALKRCERRRLLSRQGMRWNAAFICTHTRSLMLQDTGTEHPLVTQTAVIIRQLLDDMNQWRHTADLVAFSSLTWPAQGITYSPRYLKRSCVVLRFTFPAFVLHILPISLFFISSS